MEESGAAKHVFFLFLNTSLNEVRQLELKKDLPLLQIACYMDWMHGAFTW